MNLGGDQIIWQMNFPDCNQINDLNADEDVVLPKTFC